MMIDPSNNTSNMACSAHHHQKLVWLLCAAFTVAVTAGKEVVTYSFPSFDANTTGDMVAATNTSVLTPASLLFVSPPSFQEFNNSEGFLLLWDTIDIWHATGDNPSANNNPVEEASFNTSFTVVASAAPISFVVLKDAYPPLFGPGGLRGFGNYTMSAGGPIPTNATVTNALVNVDAVQSYGPDDPTTGLNVTVTVTSRGGGGCAVWVEYNAGVHRLSVYVAGAGQARPANALISMSLGADGWRWTTETALVRFFADAIRDVIVSVRDWDLTVDRFAGDGRKGTSWWVMLLAVLGSVVAAAAIVAAVVCYVQKRRRREINVDHRPKI